jgi:hypothetical protein
MLKSKVLLALQWLARLSEKSLIVDARPVLIDRSDRTPPLVEGYFADLDK